MSEGSQNSDRQAKWRQDHELMQRAHAGDEGARHAVALRAVRRGKTVARGLLPIEEAQDATQNIAMAVLDSAGRFRGDCALETWIDRIAVRVAMKMVRRSRRARSSVPWEEVGEVMGSRPPADPGEAVPRSVHEYLSELPDKQRAVLVLRYGLELSVEEVAQAAEISVNTAKSRLRTGLSKLRQLVRRDLNVGVVDSVVDSGERDD